MNETLVNLVCIACIAIVVLLVIYRLSPGLSEAMSAWAKKQQDLTVHRLAEEYVQGFQDGAEREQRGQAGRA